MGQQHTEKSTENAKEPRPTKDAREAKPKRPIEQDGTTPREGSSRHVPAEELNPDDFD